MNRITIQRIHGTMLIVLGSALAVASTISAQTGTGVYPFLLENQMAHVGLLQAYLLMAVIGITLWIGSTSKDPSWKWDVVGIIAHIPPLVAVAMYTNLFISMGMGGTIPASLTIHAIGIGMEIFALAALKSPQPVLA